MPNGHTATLSLQERIAELEQALKHSEERTEVMLWVAAHTHRYLNEEPDDLRMVVDGIIDAWRQEAPHTNGQQLGGEHGFWATYVQRVEWDTDGNGEETYRTEFCQPENNKPVSDDEYLTRVWAAHLEHLRNR